MNTSFGIKGMNPERLACVRPVNVAELPESARAQGLRTACALHSSDGERLALVRNRSLAFALARENDLAPVNVD